MRLSEILTKEKDAALTAWRRRIFDAYPPETAQFLENRIDQFQNPVGHTISQSLETLYDCLLDDAREEERREALDRLIRIRSVQKFSAGAAVGFVFLLKGVVRERAKDYPPNPQLAEDFLDFDRRVDLLTLEAFDVYAACREQLLQIRIREIERTYDRALKRSKFFLTSEPENEDHNAKKE